MEFKETISSKQRQGKYDETRYHGKYTFTIPEIIQEDTITIDSAVLTLISTASGRSAARDLWLRAGHNKNDAIIYETETTKFIVNRDATNNLILNVNDATTLEAIKSGKFGIYVDESNDNYYFTASTGKQYSSHYITFSSATLTINYSYKAGILNLDKTSIKIGSGGDTAVNATISNHISTYGYKLVVSEENLSKTYNLGNANSQTLNFTKDYLTWVNGDSDSEITSIFKEKTSVSGYITLETYSDIEYTTLLGESKVGVIFTAILDDPTLTIGTIAYANSGSYTSINSFALPEFGTVTINHTASAKNGAAIKSIAAIQNFGTLSSSSTNAKTIFTVNKGIANGTYEVSLTLTDSRGKTVSAKTNVVIKNYTKPTLSLSVVRNSNNHLEATYSYSVFSDGKVTEAYLTWDTKSVELTTKVNSVDLTTYTSPDILNETQHNITLHIKDSYGGENELSKILASTAFYLHFGSSGSTLGIGGAAPTNVTNQVRCYWDMVLDNPLSLSSGGTEAKNQPEAWENIVAPGGIFTGDITANKTLTVNNSLFVNKTLNPELIFNTDTIQRGNLRVYTGSDSGIRFQLQQNGNGINEIFQLPTTSLISNDSSTTYYDILTTKDHYYSHITNEAANIFEFGTLLIQTGHIEFGTVSSSTDYKDVSITFTKKYSVTPTIVVGFDWGSDSANAGRWSICCRAEGTDGFIARVNNGEGAGRNPEGYWIAIGKKA